MAKQYGRWTVLGDLGVGGQARVFSVRDGTGELDGTFALKRLLNTARIERLRREERALRQLDHPNVLQLVDSDLNGSKPFIVTALASKRSLEVAWSESRTLRESMRVFHAVLDGVSAAHAEGIIHRDLKPANILLEEDDTPRVADFGICYVEDGQVLTATKEVPGARYYTAPEIEERGEDAVTPQADIYSLGKILFWLITGAHLPREINEAANNRLREHVAERDLRPVQQILGRMTALDPAARYESLSSTRADVERFARVLDGQFNRPSASDPQFCVYCGVGTYVLFGDDGHGSTQKAFMLNELGMQPRQPDVFRVLVCNYCENIQWFFDKKSPASPWRAH